MVSLNTAAFIALLNCFSLNLAFGDEFYDALRSKNKYDPATVQDTRKNTVEQKRLNQVNIETQTNPNFVLLPKNPPKVLTWEEVKKKRDLEKTAPDDEDDKIQPGSAVHPANEPDSPIAPSTPTRSAGAPKPAPVESSSIKVTNEDPDEVTFEPEPTPVKKKKK